MQFGDLHLLKQKPLAGKVERNPFSEGFDWGQSNFKSARTAVLVLTCFGANSGLSKSLQWGEFAFTDRFLLALLHCQGYSCVVDPFWHRITGTWARCHCTGASGRCQSEPQGSAELPAALRASCEQEASWIWGKLLWLTHKISRLYEELTALDVKPLKCRGSRTMWLFAQFPEERSLLEGMGGWIIATTPGTHSQLPLFCSKLVK